MHQPLRKEWKRDKIYCGIWARNCCVDVCDSVRVCCTVLHICGLSFKPRARNVFLRTARIAGSLSPFGNTLVRPGHNMSNFSRSTAYCLGSMPFCCMYNMSKQDFSRVALCYHRLLFRYLTHADNRTPKLVLWILHASSGAAPQPLCQETQ